MPVKTGFGVSRRQPERWFFRPKWRGEAKIALFLLFFAFWCRGDTVQNLVSCYDEGVIEELGKINEMAAPARSLLSRAYGVRSIGAVRISGENEDRKGRNCHREHKEHRGDR